MKGTVFDVMFVAIMVVILMITIVVGHMILSEMGDAAEASGNTTLNASYFESGESALGVFNIGIVMVFIMGIIGAVILALYLDTNPVFIAISIIFLVIIVAVAMPVLTNLYNEFTLQATISDAAASYTIAKILIDALPLWVAIGGGIVIVALYMKRETRSA